jgi:hypothetical protein
MMRQQHAEEDDWTSVAEATDQSAMQCDVLGMMQGVVDNKVEMSSMRELVE